MLNRIGKISLIILFLLTSTSLADDWPQYLGPNRNSTSDQKNLLRSWGEDGPEVLWTVEVGKGFGGPVIKDGKVYLLDREDKVGDILRCFDFSDGKELWRYAYDAPGTVNFPGSRSVPIVEDNFVYSCGHNGDLYCLDINTQKPVWNKNVWTDFGGSAGGGSPRGAGPADRFPTWAITQNPLIYGDLLMVASQAPDAGVVAYDKLTGTVKWKTPSLGYVGYVSPAIVKVDGEDHVVMITPSTNPFRRTSPDENKLGTIVGIEPLTGKILWEYDKWHCHIPVPSAVDAGNNKVLVVGGYELGAVMIEVEKKAEGGYDVSELFKHNEFGDQTKPPILHDGYFYAQFSTNSRRDSLVCMNMKGEIMWKTRRSPIFDKGSMILADGLILATDGGTKLYLIEPDPTEFKPLATADLLRGGRNQNWAPMALADGKLVLRDLTQMKCVNLKTKAP